MWGLAIKPHDFDQRACRHNRPCHGACVGGDCSPCFGGGSTCFRSGHATGGTKVSFGEFGIQAMTPAYVTNRQIESARIAMTRHIKRGGKVWINIYPDRPLTKKPAETRMGSGKGSPEWWVANVKPGRILFEMAFPNEVVAREAMRRAIHKLPMKCRIVKREVGEA